MSDAVSVSFTGIDDGFSAIADRVVGKTGEVGTAAERASEQAAVGADSVGRSFETVGQKATQAGEEMDEGAKKPLISLQSLEEQALHVGERIAEAFVIKEMVSTAVEQIEDAVTAFEHEEDAVHNVAVALRAQGDVIPGIGEQYEQLSADVERSTAFSRDQIENTIAVLTTLGQVGPGNMKRVLDATLDLAQGLAPLNGGMANLESATRLMSVAMDGNAGALGRFIPELKGVQLAAGDTDTVLSAIEKHFGGEAAASVDTLSGKLRQQSNEWDHLKAVAGAMIVDPFETHVLPVMDRLATDLMPAVSMKAKETGASFEELRNKIADLGPLTAADGVFVDLGQTIGGKVAPAVAALRAQHDLLNSSTATLDPTVKQVATSLLEEGRSTQTVYEALLKAGAVTQAQKDQIDNLAASVKKAEEAATKHAASVAAEQEATRLYGADLEAMLPKYDDIAAAVKAGILNEAQIADQYDTSTQAVKAVAENEKRRAQQMKEDWDDEKSLLAEEGIAMRVRIENEDKLANAEYHRYEKDQAQIKQEVETYAAGRKQIEKADADLAQAQDNIGATAYQKEYNRLTKWEADQLASFHGTADEYDAFADRIQLTFETKIAALGPEWISDLGDMGKAFGMFASSTIGGLQTIGREAQSMIGDFQDMGKGLAQISNATSWVGAISGAISFVGALAGAIGVIASIASGIAGLFNGSPGRGAVVDFANSYGGFDILHNVLDGLPGGEDLWKEMGSIGSDDVSGANAWIAKVRALFAASSPNGQTKPTVPDPTNPDEGGMVGTGSGGKLTAYGTGGFVSRPTVAIVGDAPGGEIISPIPQLTQAVAQAVSSANRTGDDHLAALRSEMQDSFTQLRRDLMTVLPKAIRDAALLS